MVSCNRSIVASAYRPDAWQRLSLVEAADRKVPRNWTLSKLRQERVEVLAEFAETRTMWHQGLQDSHICLLVRFQNVGDTDAQLGNVGAKVGCTKEDEPARCLQYLVHERCRMSDLVCVNQSL